MKKVLVVGMTNNPGGIENVIMNYYRNIDRKKVQFDFLCNTGSIAYSDEIKKLGGSIINAPSRSKKLFKYKKFLKKFFSSNSKNYCAIWVNFCNLSNLDYLKYAKRYNIRKRIIHSHNSKNMYSKILGLVHIINKQFVEKYATDFWACTEMAGHWFFNKSIYKNHDVKIINNAIDVEKFRFNTNTKELYLNKLKLKDKLVIGHVGRFQLQKNHDFLIDIFYEVYKKNSNVNLLLVGQGVEKERIEKKVKNLNLESNVQFLGVRDDVPNIMKSIDLFLFPSLFEGLGLVLIEAQASGIPVIASGDFIPHEVKMSDNFEFLSLKQDPKIWADKVLEYIYIANKSDANIKIIRQKGYDIKIEAKKIQNFFEKE